DLVELDGDPPHPRSIVGQETGGVARGAQLERRVGRRHIGVDAERREQPLERFARRLLPLPTDEGVLRLNTETGGNLLDGHGAAVSFTTRTVQGGSAPLRGPWIVCPDTSGAIIDRSDKFARN